MSDADARLAEVARLLAEHARRSRRNGVAVMPPLLSQALLLASGVLGGPNFASTEDTSEALLVDFETAARILGTSPRTVRRYADDGRLPTVDCGGPRIRRSDLAEYVATLPARKVT